MELPNNRIPNLVIWETILDILRQDDYFCNTTNGVLYRKNNQTIAIYDRPLTSVEIVFSDNDLAIGVWHDNSVNISNKNSLKVDRYVFYIDVASIDFDIIESVKKNIKLSREIVYTLEDNLNLRRNGIILPNVEIAPIEQLDYNDNQIIFICGIKLSIEANSLYR